jgi:hypothetical protein
VVSGAPSAADESATEGRRENDGGGRGSGEDAMLMGFAMSAASGDMGKRGIGGGISFSNSTCSFQSVTRSLIGNDSVPSAGSGVGGGPMMTVDRS